MLALGVDSVNNFNMISAGNTLSYELFHIDSPVHLCRENRSGGNHGYEKIGVVGIIVTRK